MGRSILPEISTSFAFISGLLVLRGLWLVKNGDRKGHQRFMVYALVSTVLFLGFYLTRVFLEGSHIFPHSGWIRTLYFTLLTTHVTLAMTVLPLVIITVVRAYKKQIREHRRIAKFTYPIWLYVSFTGPIIYFMLHWL